MKKLILVCTAICLISCNKEFSDTEMKKLNGYWEIQVAELPDGTEKEYKVNPVIDYFEIKQGKGFRKKVMPQFDGTYIANSTEEDIEVVNEDGKTYLSYATEYAKWKEQVIRIDDEQLVVRNAEGIEYHYMKPEPFTLK